MHFNLFLSLNFMVKIGSINFPHIFSFIVGPSFSYTDLTLFHVLRATGAQFPEPWSKADYIPALKAYKDRIASRPNIAAFLKSSRAQPFAGDSMM